MLIEIEAAPDVNNRQTIPRRWELKIDLKFICGSRWRVHHSLASGPNPLNSSSRDNSFLDIWSGVFVSQSAVEKEY